MKKSLESLKQVRSEGGFGALALALGQNSEYNEINHQMSYIADRDPKNGD